MSNNKCEAGTPNCSGRLVLDEDYWNSSENTSNEKKYACSKCGVIIFREEVGIYTKLEKLGGNKIDKKINLGTSKSESDSTKFHFLVERTLKGVIPGFNSPQIIADTKSLYLLANKKFNNLNTKHLLAVSTFHTLKKANRSEQLFDICQIILTGHRKSKQDLRLLELQDIKKMERSANRLYNKLKKEEIITEVIPAKPLDFINNKIHKVATGAREIAIHQESQKYLKKMQDAQLTASKNPAGIAASLVYASMKQLGLPVKQSQIARIFGVSDLCIRKNSKELFSLLERSLA